MGISGLLPFLKDATTSANIKQFEGKTVAVDTYCWIYRGAFSCAEDLAIGTKGTDGHVKYVLKYVKKLLEWGVKPVMVFDGSCLPSKQITELKRRESKEMYKNKARQCAAEGRINEARECYQRCIECTPKMALEVIQAMHELGVDVVVAPYEADAQLAYLNKIKVAQCIITEDSDLVLFGCERILYKMDINGNGQLIEKEKIISITQFDSADNFERFRWMCILSGCDYLENLPGIGLGKARKFLKSVNKSDIEQLLKQMPKVLKMPNLVISNDYIEKFKRADKTFKYQIVFNPILRKQTPLNDYESDVGLNEDLSFAGIIHNDELSLQHSLGNLDLGNKEEKVYDFDPTRWNYKPPPKYANNPPAHMMSVWSKHYRTYNASTPFSSSNFPTRSASQSSSSSSSSSLMFTNKSTFEMSKTLKSAASFSFKATTKKFSQEEVLCEITSTNNNGKRKHDDHVLSSSNENEEKRSAEISSAECTTTNVDKRFKCCDGENLNDVNKIETIDDLLSQYSNENSGHHDNKSSTTTTQASDKLQEDTANDAEIESSTSSYFNQRKSAIDSPILTQSSKKAIKLLQPTNRFVTRNIINEQIIVDKENRMNLLDIETSSSSSTSLKLEMINDIQTMKSTIQSFAKTATTLKTSGHDDDDEQKDAKIEQEDEFIVIDDTRRSPANKTTQPSTPSRQLPKKLTKKPIDQSTNNKSITEYFSKFAFSRTNTLEAQK